MNSPCIEKREEYYPHSFAEETIEKGCIHIKNGLTMEKNDKKNVRNVRKDLELLQKSI